MANSTSLTTRQSEFCVSRPWVLCVNSLRIWRLLLEQETSVYQGTPTNVVIGDQQQKLIFSIQKVSKRDVVYNHEKAPPSWGSTIILNWKYTFNFFMLPIQFWPDLFSHFRHCHQQGRNCLLCGWCQHPCCQQRQWDLHSDWLPGPANQLGTTALWQGCLAYWGKASIDCWAD